MKPFNVHILAADHTFYDGECVSLIVPTVTGMYGIHAGHSNMISAIVPGMLSYQLEGEEMQIAAISPGIMKIENGEVLVLVDSIERPEEIDVNRAKREADAAQEAILQKRSMKEYRLAQATLSRELNRLKVKNSMR